MRVDLERDRLVVFFDENDVVLYYGITRQREDPEAAKACRAARTRARRAEPAPASEPTAPAIEPPAAPSRRP